MSDNEDKIIFYTSLALAAEKATPLYAYLSMQTLVPASSVSMISFCSSHLLAEYRCTVQTTGYSQH